MPLTTTVSDIPETSHEGDDVGPMYNATESIEMRQDFAGNDVHMDHTSIPTQLAPPPRPRLVPIPLPPLSPNIPVQTHALITYHPHISSICWTLSLPPSTARLEITTMGRSNHAQWFYDMAIFPNTLPSITIRIRGIERPLVVFPSEAWLPIQIVDVLSAVYSVVRAAAMEHRITSGNLPRYYELGAQTRSDLPVEDIIAADAIGRHFRNHVWWNGLSPSTGEVDVWVLQLRGATR